MKYKFCDYPPTINQVLVFDLIGGRNFGFKPELSLYRGRMVLYILYTYVKWLIEVELFDCMNLVWATHTAIFNRQNIINKYAQMNACFRQGTYDIQPW